MSTISSTSSTTTSQPSTLTTVAQGTAALASTATSLAQESGIVSLLGGAGPVDALGLYNSLATAGSSSAASTAAPSSLDQAIAASLAASSPQQPGMPPPVTGQSGSLDVNTNFANALKTDPSLAYTAIADSFAQGIVSTLSVSA